MGIIRLRDALTHFATDQQLAARYLELELRPEWDEEPNALTSEEREEKCKLYDILLESLVAQLRTGRLLARGYWARDKKEAKPPSSWWTDARLDLAANTATIGDDRLAGIEVVKPPTLMDVARSFDRFWQAYVSRSGARECAPVVKTAVAASEAAAEQAVPEPPRGSRVQDGAPIALTAGETLTQVANVAPDTRRPPSREKPFWRDARAVALEWLEENGCPAPGDGHQAMLEEHVNEWLDTRGHEASEATVRRHVVGWIAERRAELTNSKGSLRMMSPRRAQ